MCVLRFIFVLLFVQIIEHCSSLQSASECVHLSVSSCVSGQGKVRQPREGSQEKAAGEGSQEKAAKRRQPREGSKRSQQAKAANKASNRPAGKTA